MSQQLKSDIDQLLDGDAEQIKLAQNKLGLHKSESLPDMTRFENAIWNNYRERKTRPGAIVGSLKDLLNHRRIIPGFAFAAAAIAVGVMFYSRTIPSTIQYARLDYTQNSVSAFSFNEKIRLQLRQAEALDISGRDQNFQIVVKKIWGHFEFEKKPGNSLAIQTAQGVFSVTGTSFLLFADDKEARLLVEEGTVQVEKNGKSIAVTANEQYISGSGELKSLPIRAEEKKIFAAFRNPQLKNDATELISRKDISPVPKPSLPPIVFINVTLFDGNTISGKLISESADSIVIQPKNFKAITVRKTEIKESQRH